MNSSAHAACTVSSTSINFGTYDFLSSLPVTGNGTLTLSCTKKSTVEIAIGTSSYSGSFIPRKMKHFSLADTLDYNLYTSAAMIEVWGDGTNGTSSSSFNGISKKNTIVNFYGKITPLQNVPAGNYSEQLVVTITY